MRVIICGSRAINDYNLLVKTIEENNLKDKITVVISGGAAGADRLGERWAEENNVPIERFIPNWDDISHSDAFIRENRYGQLYDAKAGHRRNSKMLESADCVIALWDGISKGTRDTITKALKKGIPVYLSSA